MARTFGSTIPMQFLNHGFHGRSKRRYLVKIFRQIKIGMIKKVQQHVLAWENTVDRAQALKGMVVEVVINSKNIEYKKIIYVGLDKVSPDDFMVLLNKQKIREHLVDHDLFDSNTIKTWTQKKIDVDRTSGCRVRGIMLGNSFAGWCGIQLEDGKYEIAIVLDDAFWGIGKKVFNDVMSWAKELGHDEVFIHFLHTRPEYKFLRKISKNVFETEMLGNKFTTYQLAVY